MLVIFFEIHSLHAVLWVWSSLQLALEDLCQASPLIEFCHNCALFTSFGRNNHNLFNRNYLVIYLGHPTGYPCQCRGIKYATCKLGRLQTHFRNTWFSQLITVITDQFHKKSFLFVNCLVQWSTACGVRKVCTLFQVVWRFRIIKITD